MEERPIDWFFLGRGKTVEQIEAYGIQVVELRHQDVDYGTHYLHKCILQSKYNEGQKEKYVFLYNTNEYIYEHAHVYHMHTMTIHT